MVASYGLPDEDCETCKLAINEWLKVWKEAVRQGCLVEEFFGFKVACGHGISIRTRFERD